MTASRPLAERPIRGRTFEWETDGEKRVPLPQPSINTAMDALFLVRVGRVRIAARTARLRSAGLESKEDRLPRSVARIQPAHGLELAATLRIKAIPARANPNRATVEPPSGTA